LATYKFTWFKVFRSPNRVPFDCQEMQRSLLLICLIFNVDFIAAKSSTAGKTSSTYGYTRTSSSSVAGGYYVAGMNSNGHYYSKSSGCTNSNTNSCGQDAPSSEGETQRIYAFTEGTCSSHGCQILNNETECADAAQAMSDSSGVMELNQETCTAVAQCSYDISSNDVRWCGRETSNICTASRQCLCLCVIGTESSSVDVGLVLGVTFGCLFGCCLLVALYQYSQKSKY